LRRTALLAVTILAAGGGVAWAQLGDVDPATLPSFHGTVAQYSLTPRGDVDGLLLADGTEVHTPPHLGAELVATVKPGDAVTVHGLKARAIPVIQAASVTDDASGKSVVDNGPPGPGRDAGANETMITADGQVKAQLFGPRGDLNGVLLDSGAIVHLPPPEAQRLADTLAVGKPVHAQGYGVSGALGTAIAAREIGPSASSMTQIAAPPPPPPRRGPPRPDHGIGAPPPG
jgi:hypothetical protein